LYKKTLTFSCAYLLVAHGSRDRGYHQNLQQLAELIRQEMMLSVSQSWGNQGAIATLTKGAEPLVATACLELESLSLAEQISQFAIAAEKAGWESLKILPLFLLPGVHVTEDLPREVELARAILGNRVKIELLSYLGKSKGLIELLNKQFEGLNTQGRILFSHGSTLPETAKTVRKIALELFAFDAYLSGGISLNERVREMADLGIGSIAILPYFLLSGGIVTALAQRTKELQEIFPDLQLILGEPLGVSTQLANSIVKELGQ
jgi:sirohydrochlorin ferrochelatase